MDYHDQLRHIFAEHGWRARDGRSPLDMTDEEVEGATTAFLCAAAEAGRKIQEAVQRSAVAISRACKPILNNPAVMAELESRRSK